MKQLYKTMSLFTIVMGLLLLFLNINMLAGRVLVLGGSMFFYGMPKKSLRKHVRLSIPVMASTLGILYYYYTVFGVEKLHDTILNWLLGGMIVGGFIIAVFFTAIKFRK